jgi:thiamine-phosphate pyrophosphorylase
MNQARGILAGTSVSGLYAITDEQLMPGGQLLAKAEAALRGGCRLLQYRNKYSSQAQKKCEAEWLRVLCGQYRARLIINDDVELALVVKADGVHIGQTDSPVAEVRARIGEQMMIGVSCHDSLAVAQQAQQQGASYVAFGRFFTSHTKPQAPAASLDVLRLAKQTLAIPIVAIGGITRDNARRVIERGADMVAVIHEVFSPDDVAEVEARARMLSQLFP